MSEQDHYRQTDLDSAAVNRWTDELKRFGQILFVFLGAGIASGLTLANLVSPFANANLLAGVVVVWILVFSGLVVGYNVVRR